MRRRKCDNAQVANSTGASGVSSVFGLGKLAVKFPELRVLVSGFTFAVTNTALALVWWRWRWPVHG